MAVSDWWVVVEYNHGRLQICLQDREGPGRPPGKAIQLFKVMVREVMEGRWTVEQLLHLPREAMKESPFHARSHRTYANALKFLKQVFPQ